MLNNPIHPIYRNGFDVQNHLLNQRRYHTAIHYVILAYTAQGKERPAQANIRFVDILTSLIQYGVDINDKDINRQTALHMAAAKPGNSDIIKVSKLKVMVLLPVEQPGSYWHKPSALNLAEAIPDEGDKFVNC